VKEVDLSTVKSQDEKAIRAAGLPSAPPIRDEARHRHASDRRRGRDDPAFPGSGRGDPGAAPEPPRAYTSYPSEPTYCSDWYSTGDRWEFWCYLEYPEGDYWVLDAYYWEPDTQAAINYRYCGGALSYWWYVCCGMSGACDA
jgi:hypothetical protein